MGNVVRNGNTQTIHLGYRSALGKVTPQKCISNTNLKISLKSVSTCPMSELSRNNSDDTSIASSLQTRQTITNPYRK